MASYTSNLNLKKPALTDDALVTDLNENSDKLDAAISAGSGAIAIVSVGNTHAAISSGQYVYVRQHGSLSEGLYQATTNIAANGTLSGSNLTAVSGGGLNSVYSALSEQITNIVKYVALGSVTLNAGGKDAIEVEGVTNTNAIIMPYIDGYSYATTPNIQTNVIYSSNKWYIGVANNTSTNMTFTLKCRYIIIS